METPSNHPQLSITFPKSNEDHRLQLVDINGSIFAIVYSPLESKGPIRLECEDWSLIIVAPIKSKTHIVISAINIICLNEISSEEGNVNIYASNHLVTFSGLIKSLQKKNNQSDDELFQFNDDPGALLYFYRLFENVVHFSKNNDPESIPEAQKTFIAALFTLVDKMEGGSQNHDLQKVLKKWKIPLA